MSKIKNVKPIKVKDSYINSDNEFLKEFLIGYNYIRPGNFNYLSIKKALGILVKRELTRKIK